MEVEPAEIEETATPQRREKLTRAERLAARRAAAEAAKPTAKTKPTSKPVDAGMPQPAPPTLATKAPISPAPLSFSEEKRPVAAAAGISKAKEGYEALPTQGGASTQYKHEVIAIQGEPGALAAAWVKLDDLKTIRATVGTTVPGLGALVKFTATHAEFDSGRKLPLPLKKTP